MGGEALIACEGERGAGEGVYVKNGGADASRHPLLFSRWGELHGCQNWGVIFLVHDEESLT
jgi:hypothetical protein